MSNDDDKNKDKSVEDMSLADDVKHPKPLDMDLEGPDVINVGQRIQKLFPDADLVDLINDLPIVRMADGSYQVKGKQLSEIAKMDLQKIDDFLRKKEGEK